ncbi:MAG: radical SAM protein [Candidatus Methanomethylophilaceae archaeon]|nr:radical SAM protein [Candidatus Methanomethylophilaceae archaeon]
MKPYISVVVKPTLFCNTDCKHCYHTPEERVPGRMSHETLERLIRMVSEEYESAWFIWHGGEPLTMPMSFFKDAIELQEEHFGKGSFRYGNTVQTNGLQLNRRFMAYCRSKAINVGVSYEGPFNNVLREGDVSKALSALSSKENKYSVSATICRETALHQREIYEHFRGDGTNVSFSPVIPAGCARCNGTVPDPDEYIRGSIEVFDEWLHDSEHDVPLIPHYLYILNYLGDPMPADCAHTSCLTKWLCVNPNGDIYPCAKACPEEFLMGNINTVGSIDEAFRSEGFRRILLGSVKRREKCASCPIFSYCNGGCSMDAYHECGLEENGGDSCRIFREVFSHVSSEIQYILDNQPDMSGYNRFVRDAIVGKLINPGTVSL